MSENVTQRLGENVRRLRARTGMDQEEPARRAGALGTSPDEFLDGMAWRPAPTEAKGEWDLAPAPEGLPEAEGCRR